MIRFPCQCGFEFDVSDQMAGDEMQCPRCMRLNSVPLLNDLTQLEKDGTIRVEPQQIEDPAKRQAELKRAFMPRLRDDAGNDIDMRPTFEDIVNAGADEIPLEMKDELRPGAPKYDPQTGMLIKPLSVRGDEVQTVLPIAAGPPTLHYQKNYVSAGAALWKAPILMFTPGSAAVLLILFAAHLLMLAAWVPIGVGFVFTFFFILFVYVGFIAHLANVVEEIGPHDKDELPTPLRDCSWYEDLILPYWNLTIAFLLCYWPGLLVIFSSTVRHHITPVGVLVMSLSLLGLGTFFFPAVFLTTTCSGSILNLRPDRVIGVILAIGFRYLLAVGLWAAGLGVYFFSSIIAIAFFVSVTGLFFNLTTPYHAGLGVAGVLVGIYLLHVFCWMLGLFYRHYHANFPWVLQRFVSTRKTERRIVRPKGIIKAQPKDPGFLAPEPPPPPLRAKSVQE